MYVNGDGRKPKQNEMKNVIEILITMWSLQYFNNT